MAPMSEFRYQLDEEACVRKVLQEILMVLEFVASTPVMRTGIV